MHVVRARIRMLPVVAAFAVPLLGGVALADEEPPAPPAPKIAIADGSALTLRVESSGDAHVGAVVVNSGDLHATLAASLLTGRSTPLRAIETRVDGKPGDVITKTTTANVELTFRLDSVPVNPTLVLTVAGGNTATAKLTVERVVPASTYTTPVLTAAVFALGFTVLLALFLGIDAKGRKRFGQPVYTDAAWSFKDSWATNVTAIGGIVGALFAATPVVTDVFPGVATARFAGLMLLFASTFVVSPVAYIVFGCRYQVTTDGVTSDVTGGSPWGLLLSTAITLFGVAGELLTALALAPLVGSNLVSARLVWPGAVVAVLLALVGVYAARTQLWLLDLPKPASTATASGAPSGPANLTAGAV